MFQKIWATCEIGEYLLSKVNPKVDNGGEAPDPIIDERYHNIDPSIDNRGIKYLTANMETLLNERVSPRLVSYIGVPSSVCCCCCCCCCHCYCHCCCCWLYVLSFASLLILSYVILIFWRLENKFFLHLRILWVNPQALNHRVQGSVCVCVWMWCFLHTGGVLLVRCRL